MLMEKWIVRFCLIAACILIAGILFVMYSRRKSQKALEEKCSPEAGEEKTGAEDRQTSQS